MNNSCVHIYHLGDRGDGGSITAGSRQARLKGLVITGLRSFPVVGFHISGAEPLNSANRLIVN